MNVTRDVIIDLLPAYLAGDASAATRLLVDEWLAGDPELARQVAEQRERLLVPEPVGVEPAPEAELRSLRRTRRRLAAQRWLFALGWVFFAVGFSLRFDFHHGRIEHFSFALQEQPALMAASLALAAGCWIAYRRLRRP